MTEPERNSPPDLLSALVACLDGIVASDALPEGLMRGEIGWLGDGFSDPDRTSTAPFGVASRHQALEMADAARGLLDVLDATQGIPADGSLQLRRALDDAVARIGAALRRDQADRIRGLYVIVDPEVTGGRDPLEIGRAALNGGARMLQLRDKLRDKGEQLPLGTALRDLCAAHDALLIVNDHADLAAALGPDHVGLHVGQTDLPVAEARKILAPGQVLGRSNREIDLIIESQEMGADHVAFGAMYTTTTKTGHPRAPGPGAFAAGPRRRQRAPGGHRWHHRRQRRSGR